MVLCEFLMILGFGILGGYAIANKDDAKESEKVKKIEVNINPIDLWELKKLQK